MSQLLAPVMVTVDRSPAKNYFGDTVDNLLQGGVNQGVIVCLSDQRVGHAREALLERFVPTSFGVGLNAPHHMSFYAGDDLDRGTWLIDCPNYRRSANSNVARALKLGAATGKPWVLFFEDDIDVCGDFLGSIERWLADYAREDTRVYSLGANYPFTGIEGCAAAYPINLFYGTQGFVIRQKDALSLSNWLIEHEFVKNANGAAYDLIMHDWSRANYPELQNFAVTVPAFVQHTGRESCIAPRGETHTFPSWPGHDWVYTRAVGAAQS